MCFVFVLPFGAVCTYPVYHCHRPRPTGSRPLTGTQLQNGVEEGQYKLGGAFSHSAGTARAQCQLLPIITLFILGTPLKTIHLQKYA